MEQIPVLVVDETRIWQWFSQYVSDRELEKRLVQTQVESHSSDYEAIEGMVSRLDQSDGTTSLAMYFLLRLLLMTFARPEVVAWGYQPFHSDEASWPLADVEEQFVHSVLGYPQFPHTALCHTLHCLKR